MDLQTSVTPGHIGLVAAYRIDCGRCPALLVQVLPAGDQRAALPDWL